MWFPKSSPINFYNSYYINVKLTLYDRNSVKLTDGEMVIEIVRPPVLFVHGLNDTGACFAKFTSYLQNRTCTIRSSSIDAIIHQLIHLLLLQMPMLWRMD